MEDNNESKREKKKFTIFQLTIENTAIIAIILCILGIIGSFCISFLCTPASINLINKQIDSIRADIKNMSSDNLIILFGSGSVQNFLKTKNITKASNCLIVPSPSSLACSNLRDENFIRSLHGNLIIMSAKRFNEGDCIVCEGKLDNLLEVWLASDALYIRTSDENINSKYKGKKGIPLNNLAKELKKTHLDIYTTSTLSGTRNEYNTILNNLLDRIGTSIKNYYFFTKFTNKENYILLTKTYYDPLKEGISKYPIIPILTEKDEPILTDLFLYIPIYSFDKDNNIIIPDHIKSFLDEIGSTRAHNSIKKPTSDIIIKAEIGKY